LKVSASGLTDIRFKVFMVVKIQVEVFWVVTVQQTNFSVMLNTVHILLLYIHITTVFCQSETAEICC